MDTKSINLTEAEWHVMECLWEKAPQSGREICDAMAEKMGWNRSTTLTLLRRLEAKGAVASGSQGSLKTFAPALNREDAALRETADFLQRVYNGSVSLMVSALTKKQSLTREEIEELYALLKETEGKPDEDG